MRVRPTSLGLPFALGLLVLAGCGVAPEGQEPEPVVQTGEAIKGGYTDPDHPNVVGVAMFQSGFVAGICTGSLIAPNLVLTARHCVADPVNADALGVLCKATVYQGKSYPATTFGKNIAAKYMGVTTKGKMSDFKDSSYHLVSEVITPTPAAFCGNDIALLVLTKSIDPSEAKPLVPRVDVAATKKEPYYAVGFGVTVNNPNGDGSGVRRRRDDLFVNCQGKTCPSYLKSSVYPTELVGDTGTCQGDSGGPASDLDDRVFGITSRGPDDCSSPVYTDVFEWAQLIKDTAVHAAQVGKYPAMPWATGWPTDPAYSFAPGETCSVPEDCDSQRCVNDGVASYCTRLCSDAAPCPDGYTCNAEYNVCFQKHEPPKPKPTPPADTSGTTEESTGCAIAPGDDADPTKPVPWFLGAGALALALIRRRSVRLRSVRLRSLRVRSRG